MAQVSDRMKDRKKEEKQQWKKGFYLSTHQLNLYLDPLIEPKLVPLISSQFIEIYYPLRIYLLHALKHKYLKCGWMGFSFREN